MKLSIEAARQHLDYTIWASQRLLDSVTTMKDEQLHRDFGTADRSIFGTLLHLVRSEHVWINRVEGNGQGPKLPELTSIEQMRDVWTGVHRQWTAFVNRVDESELEAACSYHDLKGAAWTTPLWEILLHVVNHSTHHRGQVAGFIRASGMVPPTLDYIAYVRAKA